MGLSPTVSVFSSHSRDKKTDTTDTGPREEIMSIGLPINTSHQWNYTELTSFLHYLVRVCCDIDTKPNQCVNYCTPTKPTNTSTNTSTNTGTSSPVVSVGYVSSLPPGMHEHMIDCDSIPGIGISTGIGIGSGTPYTNDITPTLTDTHTTNTTTTATTTKYLQLTNNSTGTVLTQLSSSMVRGRFADRSLLTYNHDIQVCGVCYMVFVVSTVYYLYLASICTLVVILMLIQTLYLYHTILIHTLYLYTHYIFTHTISIHTLHL